MGNNEYQSKEAKHMQIYILWFNFYELQKQTKLIFGVRSENSDYSGRRVEDSLEWLSSFFWDAGNTVCWQWCFNNGHGYNGHVYFVIDYSAMPLWFLFPKCMHTFRKCKYYVNIIFKLNIILYLLCKHNF